MIRLGKRRPVRRAAALGAAAVTSLAMLSTASYAAAPSTHKPAPSAAKAGSASASKATSTSTSASRAPYGKDTKHANHQKGRKKAKRAINLQLLALNDFHGQLTEIPATSSSGRINTTPAGGAEYLATHLEQLRSKAAGKGSHSLTVAAGDLVGATPLISAAFWDEPTIEAMNLMDLDIASVGNHEFDQGWRELVRKQEGGCIDDGPEGKDNRNSCPDGEFEGADFQYLAANVFHEDTGETVLPGVKIRRFNGVPVAFIGMTLENTPNIVTKAGVEGLRFTDEVETANRLANKLDRKGVKSIVVLVHEGGFPSDPTAYNSCPGISGPIVAINNGLSSKIDTVVTGHTHQAYNCALQDPAGKPRLVTSGASVGRLVTEINLRINKRTRDIDRAAAVSNNHIVTRDVAKDAAMTALVTKYGDLVSAIASKVIGTFAPGVTRLATTADDSGESALGNLIADSQKSDPSAITGGQVPELAFMNPGGIRTDLVADASGNVTYGAAFATQPFNNYVVSMDMTGETILEILEQQWTGSSSTKILQVSGLSYTWSTSAPAGAKVVPGSVSINGELLDTGRTYRVVANSFLADGGDGFAGFNEATAKFFGGLDIDALAAYLGANPGYAPAPTNRINVAP